MGFFDFMQEAIAIDLGTANTLIIHNDKVVVDEPSIVAKNIRTEDQKYLLAMIEGFIDMIIETEKINSISEVDDKLLEKHFSNHIDNGSMIASNGQNYSQICALIRDMAVSSYMISEYVMTNKLGYVPVPGYYDGNVDI